MVAKFKEEFAEFKCSNCSCDCETVRTCFCSCLDEIDCPSIWAYTKSKPRRMTTEKARASGEKTAAQVQELQNYRDTRARIPRGFVGEVKKTVEREPFKDVSVFMKFFGDDWAMIHRIASDPAHQFYNLVKDLLALVGNYGSMSFKAKHLKFEHDRGRFKNVTTSQRKPQNTGSKKRKKKNSNEVIPTIYLVAVTFYTYVIICFT